MTGPVTLADTTGYDADVVSTAAHALDHDGARRMAAAFIERVLYILPADARRAALAARDRGDTTALAALAEAAREEGAERTWLGPDRDEQARYHLARARWYVLDALACAARELAEPDPFDDHGDAVRKVETRTASAVGHALAADACLLTAVPYTDMAEHHFIESLGAGREAAWQAWRLLMPA